MNSAFVQLDHAVIYNFIHFYSGPRFVLNLVRIFEGSFGGATLYENPNYMSPNEVSTQVVY